MGEHPCLLGMEVVAVGGCGLSCEVGEVEGGPHEREEVVGLVSSARSSQPQLLPFSQ